MDRLFAAVRQLCKLPRCQVISGVIPLLFSAHVRLLLLETRAYFVRSSLIGEIRDRKVSGAIGT